MSISETITSMNTNLSLAYSKCAEKGATIPENKNLENLADTIDTVQGGSEQPYTFLEYIESTGTQYIDTGVKASNLLRTNTSFAFTGNLTSTHFLFGSRISYKNTDYSVAVYKTSQWYSNYANESLQSTSPAISSNKRYTIDKNKNIQAIDSTTITNATSQFTNNYNIVIFALNNSNNINSFTSMKLYYFRMWNNNELVRDYTPAMRNSDNAVGLYDKVNNVFYENAGTGTFLAGPSLPHTLTAIYVDKYGQTEYEIGDSFSLDGYTIKAVYSDGAKVDVTSECTFTPSTLASDTTSVTISYTENGVTETCDVEVNVSPYIFVNYIQSTGTQYINTGYKPKLTSKFECSFTPVNNSTQNCVLFGVNSSTYWKGVFLKSDFTADKQQYRNFSGAFDDIGDAGDNPVSFSVVPELNVHYAISYYRDNNTVYLNCNGVEYAYSRTNTFGNYGNIWIFTMNRNGAFSSVVTTNVRIDKFKIYENSALVRDYVPVVRKTDNAVGLLDKVNNVFYGNAGTGTFLFG